MFGWLKKRQMRAKIDALAEKNPYEEVLDDELKRTAKEYALHVRELEKIKKVIEAKRRIKEMKEATERAHEALTDDEENDDEEEYEEAEDKYDDIDKTIQDIIMRPLLQKVQGASAPQPSTAVMPSMNAALSAPKQKALGLLNEMSDDEISKILKRLGR